MDPCGRFVDTIRQPYRTIMRFGTDPNQVAVVQWSVCQPGALPLGFATPFVSRDHDRHEIWPEIGEVQYARRRNTASVGPSPSPGTHAPCGDPAVWAGGYPGHVPAAYARNAFGVMLCCAAQMGVAPLGVLGYVPAIGPGGAGMCGLEDVPVKFPLEVAGGAGAGGLEDLPLHLELAGGAGLGGLADLVGLLELAGGGGVGGSADLVGLSELTGGVAAGGAADLVGVGIGTGGAALGGVEDVANPMISIGEWNSNSSVINTIDANWSAPTQANSLLIIGVNAIWLTGTGTIDTPAGYSIAGSFTYVGTLFPVITTTMFYREGAPATSTVTVTISGDPVQQVELSNIEVRGILTSGALDQTMTQTQTAANVGTGTTAATAQANEFAFALFSALSTGTGSPTNGFTPQFSPFSAFEGLLKILSATGTVETDQNLVASVPNGGMVATFKGF